jgi:NADPH-dependent curcumin reductase CurA
MISRQITLASYPKGVPTPDNFGEKEIEVTEPGQGQMLVRNHYFSLEAAIRGWLDGVDTYLPAIPLGGAIRGPTVGEVVESKHADYEKGDIVFGLNHWEEYSLLDDNTILLSKLQTRAEVPLSYYVGALGGSGQTAYVGLHQIGRMQKGQTVVISAAAGATGSVAGQIAKLKGCKVIGIVGTPAKEKCITQDLGYDAAINYKSCSSLQQEVETLCPEGVDIYYDNVGGKTLDAMLPCMKDQGHIVACGMIGDYNNQQNPTPVYNLWQMVMRQITMQGFLLYAYSEHIPDAMTVLHKWIANGDLKVLENITEGIENTPQAYSKMMQGDTIGKNLVKL